MTPANSDPPPEAADAPRLELRGIIKSFPGTLAKADVDLVLMPGEIHALLGETGPVNRPW